METVDGSSLSWGGTDCEGQEQDSTLSSSICRLKGRTSNLSQAESYIYMDEGHNEIKELISQLKEHIPWKDENERDDKVNHWEYVSAKLLMNSLQVGGDETKKEESLQELEEWIMIQEERVDTMKESHKARRLSTRRASFTRTFRTSVRQLSIRQLSSRLGSSSGGTPSVRKSLRAGLQRLLKGGNKNKEESHRPSIRRGSVATLKGRRPFANRASFDPSFKASLERAVTYSQNKNLGDKRESMNEQMRAEAKIEILVIKECLALRDSDKKVLNNELFMAKAILKSTFGKKAKKEHVIFELSCRKCKQHMNFMGKAPDQELYKKVHQHIDQAVKATASKDCNAYYDPSTGPRKSARDSVNMPKESWGPKFAEHFSKHCKKFKKSKRTEKNVIMFCRENVKVEVLQMQFDSELYWEDREHLLIMHDDDDDDDDDDDE